MTINAASATLPGPPDPTNPFLRLLPGLAVSAALAAAGMALGRIDWLQQHGLSALTLAIVLGMLMGNTVYGRLASASGAGVNFSKQNLLRWGVVLYGFRLTMQDIGRVGLTGVVIDALVLGSTFAWSCWIGTRWLGLDRKTAMLICALGWAAREEQWPRRDSGAQSWWIRRFRCIMKY